jgi:1-acyl-sn-glycerol-3-phosphate acyltransferase
MPETEPAASPPERADVSSDPRDRPSTRFAGRLPGRAASFVLEVFYRILYLPMIVIARTFIFVKREGPPIPPGPVILAPNHCSMLDPPVLQMAEFRHISFMMTEVYYNPPIARWFFQICRAIPVKEGRGNREALSVAIEALRRGWAVCIFPEGGIAKDGKLQKFHPGITMLAEAAKAPVVPVAILGSFEAFPRHRKLPKLFCRITVRHGEPIPPPETSGEETSRKDTLRSYAETIRDAVLRLQS